MSYGYDNGDGTFTFKTNLPSSWKNVSGFNNSTKKQYNSEKWYDVIGDKPVLKDWESIKSVSHKLKSNKIETVYVVVEESLEDYKLRRINLLKEHVKQLILSVHDAEEQRNAALGLLTTKQVSDMKTLIQENRNTYKTIKQLINDATTLRGVSKITWL